MRIENFHDEKDRGTRFDPRWVLLIATVLGLVWRMRILCGDLDTILPVYGSDDLFYFTQIAHFWGQNGWPSIDGLSVTTGFQPLFAILLVPFASGFAGAPLLALRVSLGLVSLLTVVTAWSLPGMFKPLLGPYRGRWAGVMLGCLWLLHPRILEVTFQGTEAALAVLCLVWSVRVWFRQKPNPKAALGFGLLLGLGCLARIDQLVLAACLIAWPAKPDWRWPSRVWSLLGLGLVLAPWVLYSVWLTGSPLQDSGRAKRLQYRHIQTRALVSGGSGQPSPDFGDLFEFKARQALRIPPSLWRIHGRSSYLSMLGWVAFCFWLCFLGIARRDQLLGLWQALCGIFPPGLAAFAVVGAYWLVLGSLRSWYYMPAHLVLGVVAVTAWIAILKPWQSKRRVLVLCGILTLWLTGAMVESQLEKPFRWEPVYHRAAIDLQARIPAGARIGAFNAGIQAATASHGRQVVNLDGVVNHDALGALENRQITDYLLRNRIEYLIDHRGAIDFYEDLGGPGLSDHLRLLTCFPVPERPAQALCLWKVVR